MSPTTRLLSLLAAVPLVLAGCQSDDGRSRPAAEPPAATPGTSASVPEPGPGRGDRVVIKTFIFRPDPLTVPAGTTVTWSNLDEILHTVTAGPRGMASGRFDADLDGAGSTFEFTFTAPGSYPYHCTIHPGMDATVVVE